MKTKELVFKFDGPNVNTRTFGKDFIPLLFHVSQLVEACSGEAPSVLEIENNCVKIKLLCLATAVLFTGTAAAHTIKNVPMYNTAVRKINDCMKAHGATLEYHDGTKRLTFGETKTLPVIVEKNVDIRTTMTIYGELLDVGGANPNAHICSAAFEDDVKIDVNRDMAKQLASRLYEQVGVRADVVIRNGKIVSGKALSIVNYEPQPIEAWLKATAGSLGTNAFEGMDIDAFIAEQRT